LVLGQDRNGKWRKYELLWKAQSQKTSIAFRRSVIQGLKKIKIGDLTDLHRERERRAGKMRVPWGNGGKTL